MAKKSNFPPPLYSPPRAFVHCPATKCENNFKKLCTATDVYINEESKVTCFKGKV